MEDCGFLRSLKLEEMGECTEIPVHMTHYINPLKNVTGSSIRVRGNPGGHLWRTWNERRQSVFTKQNSDSCKSDNQFLLKIFPECLYFLKCGDICPRRKCIIVYRKFNASYQSWNRMSKKCALVIFHSQMLK